MAPAVTGALLAAGVTAASLLAFRLAGIRGWLLPFAPGDTCWWHRGVGRWQYVHVECYLGRRAVPDVDRPGCPVVLTHVWEVKVVGTDLVMLVAQDDLSARRPKEATWLASN